MTGTGARAGWRSARPRHFRPARPEQNAGREQPADCRGGRQSPMLAGTRATRAADPDAPPPGPGPSSPCPPSRSAQPLPVQREGRAYAGSGAAGMASRRRHAQAAGDQDGGRRSGRGAGRPQQPDAGLVDGRPSRRSIRRTSAAAARSESGDALRPRVGAGPRPAAALRPAGGLGGRVPPIDPPTTLTGAASMIAVDKGRYMEEIDGDHGGAGRPGDEGGRWGRGRRKGRAAGGGR